ncbi:TetR/AcrR family transcriptional regulator [Promicromonospora thailandica]|uniref:Transcriptional regulator, TetR family n=1 Tax=Promicromonospora thailandica TaxID=765201 RepID=A0A9X2JU55_9MICO|nr:TetR/AcrR family transcriptional regulator [Promicromonospora thailandica]MCP2264165.1 transcriptional regulator, TetR family [Promicromonospora thailandica]BFF21166.1 TetR/AcrR family transcriptional regulator [Promicromonospora thailandica]
MPRRSPNPNTVAGERILLTASELFYERGIRGVGVDLIADQAGVTKKTLYDRFGSKDALVAAYLTRRRERWVAWFGERLAARVDTGARPGADQVLAALEIAEEWAQDNTRGCAFVNAHAEIGALEHPGNAVVLADKRHMLGVFTDLVRAGGYADAEALGAQVHLLYEGAIIAHSTRAQPDAFGAARAAVRALLARPA